MQIAEKENTMPKSEPSQSGRSMVEMLVVLVIMGVLSVGGIAGFNWGMNRYRANRVVSEMQRDSAILKQRYRLAGQLNSNTNRVRISDASYASQINAEIDDMTVRYTTTPVGVDSFADCGAGRFVQVAKISGDICDHLIEMDSLSPVARYTGCPVVLNGAVLVQADGKIADDVECLEQNNALVIGVRPDTQGGVHGAVVASKRSCRVKGDVIAHGTERDCGECDDGVMKKIAAVLGECETCGPATGYMIQDDPTCGGCTPSDVCYECVDGSEVLIDAGKTKVKTGSPDTCVECLVNTDCTDPAKPVCNADNACEACTPVDICYVCVGADQVLIDAGKTKVKTGSPDTCVECLTNTDCTDPAKPVCNADNACEACPAHSSTTVTAQRIGETDCYCEPGYMVNGTGDACVVETNICGYSLDSTQSDCSYSFESVYAADCDYTFENVYAADCSYTYTSQGNGSVSASGGSCGSGQYCNVQWTASSWSAGSVPWVTDSSMGQLYGKCQSLGTAVTTSGGDMLVSASGGSCDQGEYCNIQWTAQSWTAGAVPWVTDSSSGHLWGKCQSLGVAVTTSGGDMLVSGTSCGAGQYCGLFWTAESWSGNPPNVTDSSAGTIYGKCQSFGTFIPALTVGTARLNDQKTCSEGQYCKAQYANPQGTTAISDSTTGAAYGTCVNR